MERFDVHLAEGDFSGALAAATTQAQRAVALERLGRLAECLACCTAQGDTPAQIAMVELAHAAAHTRRQERSDAFDALTRAEEARPGWLVPAHLGRALRGYGAPAPHHAEVVALFDDYARRFDAHLLGDLGYVGHEVLAGALHEEAPVASRGVVIDLGCGTGLCGALLRHAARRLVGVDVSPRMLAEAAKRHLYDALAEGDLVYALATLPDASVDALVAADALGYVGPLEALFAEAARVLRPGGALAFTIEATRTHPYELHASRRVAFAEGYVRDLAADNGFAARRFAPTVLRHEAGDGVLSWLVVLEAGAAAAAA
ncbi:MAG: methyltransferase domain-containing protein [Deltaproteobacteria bacterium]|nr:methyltransferase domain-containing protein [Deltaproteobacteria bacterium]